MTKSFIDEVPREIEQAAEILGASRWRTIFEIVLPLIRSGLVATFLFILILTWSEYCWPDHHQDRGHDAADRAVEIPGHDRRPRLRPPGGARDRHHHSADDHRPDHPQASRARLQLRHGTEIAVARIELGLRKTFGSGVAVRDSATIADGEFVVLVGRPACGKTTTLRMIAGFRTRARARSASTAAWSTTSSRATAASAWCSRATLFFRTRRSRRTSSSACA